MKKVLLSILFGISILTLAGCSVLSGLDEPENFTCVATGRQLTFTWDGVPGAKSYILTTEVKGQSWEPYESNVLEARNCCFEFDENSSFLYGEDYKFTLCAVSDKNMKGPKTDKLIVRIEILDSYSTKLYLSKETVSLSEDKKIHIEWDNLKYRIQEGSYSYGAKGIRYDVYRESGSHKNTAGIWSFVSDGTDPKIVAKEVIPEDSFQEKKLSFDDTDIEAGKTYYYFIIPYNDACWVSPVSIKPGTNGIDIKMVEVVE